MEREPAQPRAIAAVLLLEPMALETTPRRAPAIRSSALPALPRMVRGLARTHDPTAPRRAWTLALAARVRPAERARPHRPPPRVPMRRLQSRHVAARSPSVAGGAPRPRRRAATLAAAAPVWAPPSAGRAASSNDCVRCSSIETSFSASHATCVREATPGLERPRQTQRAERSSMPKRRGGGGRCVPAGSPRELAPALGAFTRRAPPFGRARPHLPTGTVRPGAELAPCAWPSFSLTEPARDRSMDAPISGGLLGNHCERVALAQRTTFVPASARAGSAGRRGTSVLAAEHRVGCERPRWGPAAGDRCACGPKNGHRLAWRRFSFQLLARTLGRAARQASAGTHTPRPT